MSWETAASERGAEIVGEAWKEEAKRKERAVELQELAKAMKDRFGQTMSALSPSLTTLTQFPPSPPGVSNSPLVADERR